MTAQPVWTRWLRVLTFTVGPAVERPTTPSRHAAGHSTCPHCTNLDTTTAHCTNGRCGWSSCTCGAVIYGGRRHRHPRHGSAGDTCHDPVAAA